MEAYLLFIPVLLYILWIRHMAQNGKIPWFKDRSVTVRYTPPKRLGLLQSAFLLDTAVDKFDILPAIIELAQQGYLEVKRTFGGLEFRRIRGTDTSRLSEDQRYLLHGILFPYEAQTFSMDRNDSSQREELREKLDILKIKLDRWAAEAGYFSRRLSESREDFLKKASLGALPILGLILYSLIQNYGEINLIGFLMAGPVFALGLFMLVTSVKKRNLPYGIISLMVLGFGLFFFSHFFAGALHGYGALLSSPQLWAYTLLLYAAAHSYLQVAPYTPKGAEIHYHMLGLRTFIAHVEKDRIDRFLREDPHYLDRLLPYAMFFGYGDSWGELYNELKFELPLWFRE